MDFNVRGLDISHLFRLDNLTIGALGSAVVSFMDFMYGEGKINIVMALFCLIAMDWLSGIAAAKKDQVYSSAYGISGMYRTIFILTFPAAANFLDHALGLPGILFYFVSMGLIYHTFHSVTANIVRAGWSKWIPKKLIDFVASEIEAKNKRSQVHRKKRESA